jgi:protein-tyrosine phosphatase
MLMRILFVCLGNICRSPTAHGVFANYVREAGLENYIEIDSAGTGDWHIGKPPDLRTQQAALKRGFDLSALRARQVKADDLDVFDLILVMDKKNFRDLRAMASPTNHHKVQLFLDYAEAGIREVPDPYYEGEAGFEQVLDLVEQASAGLLASLRESIRLKAM